MFVRMTWVQMPPERLDERIANYPQQIQSAFGQLPGFRGMALLANRATGAGVSASYWDSAETMQASEEAGNAVRQQAAAQATDLQLGEVDRFEFIIQERIGPPRAGDFLRLNDVQGSPAKIDDVANLLRERALPVAKTQPGFRAMLMAANRQTGRTLVASAWETAADREASDAAFQGLRSDASQVAGADTVKVGLYEYLFAEVRTGSPAEVR
jgi:heme-degrading monooxygenase HmoA